MRRNIVKVPIVLIGILFSGIFINPVLAASDGYFHNLYLDDNTQIQVQDPNHRILFRRSENKLELREYGDILFSAGSTSGQETDRMFIKANGFVGIGTSNPLSNLHVAGDAMFSRPGGSILYIQTPASDARIYAPGKNILFPEGNIGIGTYNPTRKLSVNGTILTKEVIVSTASSYWPDYVFEKDYNLMSLSDLTKYIQENKHLPDISSASEIEKDGIPVGEMQKKQMAKIEELTLYIIQLEKRISDLEAKIK